MKNKVQIGQCYEKNDHVYMVIDKALGLWILRDTLTWNIGAETEEDLIKWRRPFPNCG